MAHSAEEKETTRRTPRKRATRKSVAEKKTAQKSVRKVAPKKKLVEAPAPERREPEVSETERKAPTTVSTAKVRKKQLQQRAIVVGVLIVIGVGASAVVGLTDAGQINVSQVIKERNERIKNNTATESDLAGGGGIVSVPVQQKLAFNPTEVGLGDVEPPAPEPTEIASSTSSTTAATATSTEAVSASSTEAVEETVEESATTTESGT